MQTERPYSFSSDPRAVTIRKKQKYREEEEQDEETANIMYDPRVVRGSTIVSRALSKVRLLSISPLPTFCFSSERSSTLPQEKYRELARARRKKETLTHISRQFFL